MAVKFNFNPVRTKVGRRCGIHLYSFLLKKSSYDVFLKLLDFSQLFISAKGYVQTEYSNSLEIDGSTFA